MKPEGWLRAPGRLAPVLVLLAFWWGSHTTGLVSSNDGSHLALARALVLRGEVRIDPEVELTLRVDLAHRDGHFYSDRPPGTAFFAAPAVLVGHWLDGPLLRLALARGEPLVVPACPPYVDTYVARARPEAAPLAAFQGTALALALHGIAVGLLGLVCVNAWLARQGIGERARPATVLALGLGSLWGPYSTTLFSHATALAATSAFLLGLSHVRDRATVGVAALTGLSGAWAVAADYLLALPVVGAALLCAPWRRGPGIVLGALPVAVAVLAYHDAAFGSPFALGYEHHANFRFARAFASTFDGNFVAGAWTLLGAGGGGAGLIAQAPVWLLGLAGPSRPGRGEIRLALAFSPWLVLLCLHHTPAGGASADHRYLTPLLPLLGLGLARALGRWGDRALFRAAVAGLTIFSVARVWSHFLGWHETPLLHAPAVGLLAAAITAALCSAAHLVFSRRGAE